MGRAHVQRGAAQGTGRHLIRRVADSAFVTVGQPGGLVRGRARSRGITPAPSSRRTPQAQSSGVAVAGIWAPARRIATRTANRGPHVVVPVRHVQRLARASVALAERVGAGLDQGVVGRQRHQLPQRPVGALDVPPRRRASRRLRGLPLILGGRQGLEVAAP